MPEFVARLREVANRQFRELADGDRELLREAADLGHRGPLTAGRVAACSAVACAWIARPR